MSFGQKEVWDDLIAAPTIWSTERHQSLSREEA